MGTRGLRKCCHCGCVNDIDYRYVCPATGKEKRRLLHAVICEESWEEIAPELHIYFTLAKLAPQTDKSLSLHA